MNKLDGTWIYQSLRPSTAPPSPIVPWSPKGRLQVTTDESGKVDGKLLFPDVPGLALAITGSITPAVPAPARLPEGVHLTGKVTLRDGRESVNELRGFFVDDGSNAVVIGTIVAVHDDPGGEPDGTSGPFVLFPAR